MLQYMYDMPRKLRKEKRESFEDEIKSVYQVWTRPIDRQRRDAVVFAIDLFRWMSIIFIMKLEICLYRELVCINKGIKSFAHPLNDQLIGNDIVIDFEWYHNEVFKQRYRNRNANAFQG